MKFTTEQYLALKEAYASGTVSYSYMGQAVAYRSLEEMRLLLEELEADLYPDTPRGVMSRASVGIFSKGL